MKKISTLLVLAVFAINVSASNTEAAKEKEIQDLYWKAVKFYRRITRKR
jgi:hypothetical protein